LVDVIYPIGHNISLSNDVVIILNISDVNIGNISANITRADGAQYLLSEFSTGLANDYFDTNTLGTNWEFRNDTVETGQTCSADIDGNSSNEVYMEIVGNAVGTTDCGLVGIDRLEGNFDVNVSFNIHSIEDDGYLILRSTNERSLISAGVRAFVFIFSTGGQVAYLTGYDDGSGVQTSGFTPTNEQYGKLRIRRTNTTGFPVFDTYYWNNTDSSWLQLLTSQSLNQSDQDQFVQIYLESNNGAINATLDNFSVGDENNSFAIFNQTTVLGQYNVTISVNDTVGNLNDSESTTFYIISDNNPPSAPQMTNPKTGSSVRGIINITWNPVSDLDGDSVRFNITLLNADLGFNTTLIDNYGTTSTIRYEWDATAYQDASYVIRVTAYENETIEKLSSSGITGSFKVDNSAPAVTNIVPNSGTIENIGQTIEVGVNISDFSNISSAIANMTYPNGTVQEISISNSTGYWFNSSFTMPLLMGQYNITILANDTAGNLNDSINISFIGNDSIAPNINFTNPSTSEGNHSQNYITVNVTASDSGVGLQSVNITLFNSSYGIINSSYSSTSPLHVNFSDLSDGVYYVNATANDSLNNKNYTGTRRIVLDTTNPNAILSAPANNTLTSTPSQNLSVNLTDDGTGISNATLYVYNSSGLYNQTTSIFANPLTKAFGIIIGMADGVYSWFFNIIDVVGNTFTTGNWTISIDTSLPTVTLNNPPNNAVDVDGDIAFNCSGSDSSNLNKIDLYVNNTLTQEINVTGFSNGTTFNVNNLGNGNYNWSCIVYDEINNSQESDVRNFTVNTSASPTINISYFTGNTTNWSNAPDITNVTNATLDVPNVAMIQWQESINAEGANFTLYINFSNNLVEVNSNGLNETFNSSAIISIRNLTWDATPLVYMNDVICHLPDCTNASYNTVTGEAVFNVTHFTNFTTQGNTQLGIWDQTDADKDNLTKYPGQPVVFYANYTKKTNNQPIAGATCLANFTDNFDETMDYNATSLLYEYNRSFSTNGTKDYNITCSAAGSQTAALTDSSNITKDVAEPSVSLNSPAPYLNTSSTSLNFNWTAIDNVDPVLTCNLTIDSVNNAT
ncbi:MAG: hypothetical protein KAS32_16545, partial [Candidatus Peribacteraceae bacterium]|nr:hypothetical protein [Candidatus Peribacteraceae bacterium]